MLAEVTAVDVDAGSSASLPLFVRCHRQASATSASSRAAADTLRVALLDAQTLCEAAVSGVHKPRALDCTGVQYVTSVEKALSPLSQSQQPRFQFRWDRVKMTLTLMETAEFAMKYTAIKFKRVEEETKWREMLHSVATEELGSQEKLLRQQEKTAQLENLVQKKDELLERALKAKQSAEDTLFAGFCAVLNAKKDEIQRLKNALAVAEARADQAMEGKSVETAVKRKRPPVQRARKATGAKLKKKKVGEGEDEDMSDDASDKQQSAGESSSDEMENMNTDEGRERKRKRDAVKAYSQLPADLRRGSQKICSAEEMLSNLDDVMNDEVEADEAQLQVNEKAEVKKEPKASPRPTRVSRLRSRSATPSQSQTEATAMEIEPTKPEATSPPNLKPSRKTLPASPAKSMDSEEEDILDMLS